MKSTVLSLLVAAVVSFGAASAQADASREMQQPGLSALLASAKSASDKASQHSQAAVAHRTAARQAEAMAGHCLKIAADDEKYGFPYQAGLMRAKAAEYKQSAAASHAAAAQEEALAARWRAVASEQMQKYQQTFSPVGPAPHKPGTRPGRG